MGFLDLFFGPPSRHRFARMMAEAIREAGEPGHLSYEADEFRLVARWEGGPHLFNLGNAYQEYCAAPRSRRPQVLKHFVRTWFSHRKEIPSSFEDVRPDLLPTVRGRAYFELMPLQVKVDDMSEMRWPYQPLAEHLGVGLVYDLPESMMQLQQHTLDEWGVGFEDALEAACTNLAETTRNRLEPLAGGAWVSPWKDSYDATRMLLPAFIRDHAVGGEPVVMVPNRDTLLLAGSDDNAALAVMLDRAEQAVGESRFVSGIPFLLEADTWVPFLPAKGHPLRARIKMHWIKTLGQEYAAQAEVLKALDEKQGADRFVASYSALRNEDTGDASSYCLWSEGVDALLPRTDEVYFFRPTGAADGKLVARASWERVAEVVGDLMERQDLYPERYRVTEFPTESQLVELDR